MVMSNRIFANSWLRGENVMSNVLLCYTVTTNYISNYYGDVQ